MEDTLEWESPIITNGDIGRITEELVVAYLNTILQERQGRTDSKEEEINDNF
jgi:hypothetical protein